MITLIALSGGFSGNGVLDRFTVIIRRIGELVTSYQAETFAFVVLGATSCEPFEMGACLVEGFNLSASRERVISLELETGIFEWQVRRTKLEKALQSTSFECLDLIFAPPPSMCQSYRFLL
jgi:hypothetical protein